GSDARRVDFGEGSLQGGAADRPPQPLLQLLHGEGEEEHEDRRQRRSAPARGVVRRHHETHERNTRSARKRILCALRVLAAAVRKKESVFSWLSWLTCFCIIFVSFVANVRT